MNSALIMCLQLPQLALGGSPALTLIAPKTILVDLFGGACPDQAVRAAADVLDPTKYGRVRAEETLHTIDEMLRHIDSERSESVQRRVEVINRGVETVRALLQATGTHSLQHISLDPIDIELFRLVQRLYVEPVAGQPATTIIGPSMAPEQPEEAIIPSGTSEMEQKARIKIVYGGKLPYPRLNVALPCLRSITEDAEPYEGFTQRPRPEYDLDVYTHRERDIGSIKTRRVEQTLQVLGRNYTITFPVASGFTLLATRVYDKARDAVVCQTIRIVEEV